MPRCACRAQFCLPDGIELCAGAQPPLPTPSSFVLTVQNGLELYGACLTFYEELDWQKRGEAAVQLRACPAAAEGRIAAELGQAPAESTAASPAPAASPPVDWLSVPLRTGELRRLTRLLTLGAVVWAPKVLCLLSYWPYLDCLEGFLMELYRVSVGSSAVPIERYVQNLWETPIPRPRCAVLRARQDGVLSAWLLRRSRRLGVQLRIGRTRLLFEHSPIPAIPSTNVRTAAAAWHGSPLLMRARQSGPEAVFQRLSLPSLMRVLAAMLLEKWKVVLFSTDKSTLAPAAEALRSFLFPFQWQYACEPSALRQAVR